jgi:hypothetical protein
VSSWPVLEDEWMLTLIRNGWRVPPDLVPEVLDRHRTDPIRRARAELACGPLAGWLVGHLPELAARGAASSQPDPSPEDIAELPPLPVPPGLTELIDTSGDIGSTLASSIVAGDLGAAHRAVLVNLIARVRPESLEEIATALGLVESTSPGYGLAVVLADLALTRLRMLDELR